MRNKMKFKLLLIVAFLLAASSAQAKYATFSANSSDNADGECRVTSLEDGTLALSGTFGGGTATLRVLAEGGDKDTAADWLAVKDYTSAAVERIDFGNKRTVQFTLSGATTPSLRCEINKG
jgi:hypothetical protein